MGARVGPMVGATVGAEVGVRVGTKVGAEVGAVVGEDVGAVVGDTVGIGVGKKIWEHSHAHIPCPRGAASVFSFAIRFWRMSAEFPVIGGITAVVRNVADWTLFIDNNKVSVILRSHIVQNTQAV